MFGGLATLDFRTFGVELLRNCTRADCYDDKERDKRLSEIFLGAAWTDQTFQKKEYEENSIIKN